MKILEKLKKLTVGFGAFLLILPTKVMAVQNSIFEDGSKFIDPKFIAPTFAEEYGVPAPSPILMRWRLARTFIIPIALLIGLIVYFKKSKSSKKKKILTTIGIILLTIILYFAINKFIN